mgnify:CR=1 FL=1
MTLQQFIDKHNGKYLEVAGSSSAKNQCVDLANAYIRDVLGLPIIEWTNAREFPFKAGDKYSFILNTPTGIPEPGDLLIWNNTTAGHIAIFIEGNARTFKSFDQNNPIGTPCHIQGHTFAGVSGWLRCKISNEPITQDLDIRLKILDENNIKTEGDLRSIIGASKELPSLREDKLNADKEIERLRHQVDQNKTDLKMESDANSALKSAHEDHLQSIGKAVGNGPDLPGILQHISLLASKADLADKYEKELGAVRNNNADLKAEIQRKNDAYTSLSLKLDSAGAEISKLKAVVGDWLNLAEVNEQTVLGALRGLTGPGISIWGGVVKYIKRLLKK